MALQIERQTRQEAVRRTVHDIPFCANEYATPAPRRALPGRPRVLVAEDDDDLRFLICEELRFEGLDVIGCANAREAVRQREWIHALLGDPWSLDVVVSDLCLGDIDGLALLQRMAEADVDVPVVLISGFADLKARVRAGQLGAAAFLDKPVAMETLRSLVDQLARERQRRVRGSALTSPAHSWRRFEGRLDH